ncbi:hemicentin-1-like [Montipora capricornis]|uniref:hemicentin-1-like n=1 Tax=Montipora capricornis TaxID=246305 RepID=UPI0035F1C0CB
MTLPLLTFSVLSAVLSVPSSIQPISNKVITEGVNLTLSCHATVKAEITDFVANATTVCQNDIVTFNCSAVGNPSVNTYLLYVNGVVNDSNRFGNWSRSMTTGGVLNFTCVANNTLGSDMRKVAVTVNVSSSIQPISNKVITEGVNLTLACHATGIPPPTVFWVSISNGERTNGTELVIRNIRRSEAGEYRCEARNPCGNASESATIDVQFKAEIVDFVANATTVCQNDIITLDCSAVGNPAIDTYLLYVNGVVDDSNRFGNWSRKMTTGGVLNFTCVANNTLGTDRSTVSVTVNVSSSIMPISNEVITEGGNVNLSCHATGIPPPTVFWVSISNGQPTNETELVFRNIRRGEAGEYRCEARNPCGDASDSVTIDVQFKGEIVDFVANATTVCQNDIITLDCSAVGNPAIDTYLLYVNGVVDDSNRFGNWSRKMTTGGVLNFTCVANNTLGTDRSTVSVTVNVSSSIQPVSNKVITEGGNLNLSCQAFGIPPPTVFWIKTSNGQPTNETELVFRNIRRGEAGEYRCDARNPCGDASDSVTIDVQYKAEIVDFVANATTVCQNDIITLDCSAVGNPAIDTYLLYVDGVVDDSNRFGNWSRSMTTGGVLNFTCVANNTFGTDRSTVSVTVNVSSSIQPVSNKVITEGVNLTLSCHATGIPPPTVFWVSISNGERTNGTELVIRNIRRSEAGEYRCEARNPCGNASESATIDVQFKAEIVNFVANATTVCQNDIITLDCSAVGNPAIDTYLLYVDGVVDNSSRFGNWSRSMTTGGVLNFTCVANNTLGTDRSTVSVTVNVSSSIEPISNKVITEGVNLTLSCRATGIPVPTVFWVKTSNGQHTNGTELAFGNISRSEAGEYRCEAWNPCGNVSESATIDVQYPPEGIQLHVSEDVVCNGTTISFNCSAETANPTELNYQLLENNVIIFGISSTGVWNKTMEIGGVFVYRCMVNNTVGTAMSATASVTTNVSSSIQTSQDKVVREGGNVTLLCNASGIPEPLVSWINVSNDQPPLGNVLIFTNITRSQTGEYGCKATNPCGNATESTTIHVHFEPEMVLLDPSATTVCREYFIVFNCSAYSNPEVHTYELYVNGTMVNETSRTGIWNITMATGGVFDYKCIVNNTIGTARSTDVSVTVNEPSSIRPFTKKKKLEGENLTLLCEATGTPPLTVSWVKTSAGERTNAAELLFTYINRTEAGEYRCEASNLCGNAFESVEIDVLFKPEMVQLFVSEATVCNGTSITFNCSAYSNPMVHTYHLYENENMVQEISSTGVWTRTMSTGGEFVFKCMVNNTVGTAMSANVSVIVNVSSSIEAIEGNMTLTEGENLNLSCQASGDPLPFVSWIIVGGGQHTYSNLVLTNIQRNQSGEYRCEARNPCNVDPKVVTVDVQYLPEITHISIPKSTIRGDVVTLNCIADGNPVATVRWTRLSDDNDVNMPLAITGEEYEGNYRCTASNSVGSVTKDTSIVVKSFRKCYAADSSHQQILIGGF